MFVQNELSENEILLKAKGALTGDTAEEFQKSLQSLAAGGHKFISLDLSEVTTINSPCIGKILLLRKSLAEQDRVIRIRGCSDALYNTFQLIKLDRLVSIERDQAT
jgi:anti-anti-sigma factor